MLHKDEEYMDLVLQSTMLLQGVVLSQAQAEFHKLLLPILGAHPASCKWVQDSFPGVKRPLHGVD
jgi:hypothetical protein